MAFAPPSDGPPPTRLDSRQLQSMKQQKLRTSSIMPKIGEALIIFAWIALLECSIKPFRFHQSRLLVIRWLNVLNICKINHLNARDWAVQSLPKTVAAITCFVAPFTSSYIPRRNTSSPGIRAPLSKVMLSGKRSNRHRFFRSCFKNLKRILQSDGEKESMSLWKLGVSSRILRDPLVPHTEGDNSLPFRWVCSDVKVA